MAPLDFTEYDRLVNLFRKGSPNIAKAFDENKRLLKQLEGVVPPPSGLLNPLALAPGTDRYNPANYKDRVTGQPFVVIDVPPAGGRLGALAPGGGNNNTSYFLRAPVVDRVATGTARTYALHIDTGRDVVHFKTKSKVTVGSGASGDGADPVNIQVDDGDPGGEVFSEGFSLDGINGYGTRTKRRVVRQFYKIKVFAPESQAHADGIQGWDRGPATLVDNIGTIYTNYQALTALLAPNPTRWDRTKINIRPLMEDGLLRMGNAIYFDAGNTPDPVSGPWCLYPDTNKDLWIESGFYNASYRKKLDDILCLKRILAGGGLEIWPYEMYPGPGQTGTKYTSPLNPAGGSGNSTGDLGRRQGDRITFERVPHINEEWNWGIPPGGDFVTDAMLA